MRKRKFFKFFFYTLFLTVIKIKSKIFAFDEESFFQKTVILTHPVFSKHIISYDHPESPERIKYILKELKERKLNKLISNFDMQRNVYSWIDTIHSRKHINSLKKKFPLAEKSSESAVKACLEGIDLIMKKKTENVFCVLRPPGHHALNTGKDEGFCFYNHIAIAAKYLKIKYKKKKYLLLIGIIIMVIRQNIFFIKIQVFYFSQLMMLMLTLEQVSQIEKVKGKAKVSMLMCIYLVVQKIKLLSQFLKIF